MATANDIIKLVIVGDGAVGKTCMLISYTTSKFPEDYVPTVFDNYKADIVVNGRNFILSLFDTAGQEDYDRLRPMSYPHTDIFVVAFSVNDLNSFNNVRSKWVPELRAFNPQAKIILVGTKADTRKMGSSSDTLIPKEDAQRMCEAVDALKYLECSAKTQEGLKDVFDEAIKVIVSQRKPDRGGKGAGCCEIM